MRERVKLSAQHAGRADDDDSWHAGTHAFALRHAELASTITARTKTKSPDKSGLFFTSTTGGASRSRTGLNGFAGRCITNKINVLSVMPIRVPTLRCSIAGFSLYQP
jgi:hypothetical protein